MFGLGPLELIIIGTIIFLIFGAKRIPEIGKGLGGALREFKKIKREIGNSHTHDQEKPPEAKKTHNQTASLSEEISGKMIEQIPGVKKAMDIKKKVKKVKEGF